MSELTIRRMNSSDPGFATAYDRLLQWDEGDLSAIEARVAAIVQDVRQRGDAAVIDYTQRFDRLQLTPETLAFTREEIDAACEATGAENYAALELAAKRIWDYHKWQMPEMGVQEYQDSLGITLGQRLVPLRRVGLYVPGGLASYPSSVLMNAIPARVAGVGEMIMVVPTPDGVVNPLILAATRISGIDQVFRVGGAQAVAALAYGTDNIPSVDKIVGPGNIYVATAKRQVFGKVGIDMIAGPSEILVIADGSNNPRWIAADLLSQAEHDEAAQSILITNDPDFANAVEAAIWEHLSHLERRAICLKALNTRGAIIVARDIFEACQLASHAAPEHLELAVDNPHEYVCHIRNAGALFLGRLTPEAMGDYVAGPNHVLPTSGTARFSSPLGVHDFIKRSSIIGCTAEGMRAIGPVASRLAASEGLTAHKLSVDLRLEETP